MKKLIQSLIKAGRKDLAKKVKAKIRLFQTPLEQKDILVENLVAKDIPISRHILEMIVLDLLIMTRKSYNATLEFLTLKYKISEPVARIIVDTVSLASDLRNI